MGWGAGAIWLTLNLKNLRGAWVEGLALHFHMVQSRDYVKDFNKYVQKSVWLDRKQGSKFLFKNASALISL